MNNQEQTIIALVKDKDAEQIQGEIRGLAKDALQAGFRSMQDALGVESGDNACYYLNGSDFETFEKGALAWFEYYASREIADFIEDYEDVGTIEKRQEIQRAVWGAFPRPTKEKQA